jgi:hypothetical protein
MPSTRKIIALLADLLKETMFVSAPLHGNSNNTLSYSPVMFPAAGNCHLKMKNSSMIFLNEDFE